MPKSRGIRCSAWSKAAGACARALVVCSVPFLFAGPALGQTPGVGLLEVADYPLPGKFSPDAGLSFDPNSNRMYIADPVQGVVRVFETANHTFVGSVAGVAGVDRLLAVPETGRVYATTTGETAAKVIDPDALSIVHSISVGDDLDGLAYAPSVGKLYVSNKRGATATVIDVHAEEVVASIDLGAMGGSPVFDAVSGHILLALPSQDQIATIDPQTDGLLAVNDIPGCRLAHGLTIDGEQHLAFIGCQANASLAVMDLDSMQLVALVDLGKTPEALVFEPQLRMVYVATEDGVVHVFREDPLNRGALQLVTNPGVGPNAHSFGLDAGTRHLYVLTLDIRSTPVPARARDLVAIRTRVITWRQKGSATTTS